MLELPEPLDLYCTSRVLKYLGAYQDLGDEQLIRQLSEWILQQRQSHEILLPRTLGLLLRSLALHLPSFPAAPASLALESFLESPKKKTAELVPTPELKNLPVRECLRAAMASLFTRLAGRETMLELGTISEMLGSYAAARVFEVRIFDRLLHLATQRLGPTEDTPN